MKKNYEIYFLDGDYKERQQKANALKCAGYLELHFNAVGDHDVNYTCAIVANNASQSSKNWASWYVYEISNHFNIPTIKQPNGILIGGWGGRGENNLKYTQMPAILLEPFFISSPIGEKMAAEKQAQDDLSSIIVHGIRLFFPHGGKLAFSIGHKGKSSNPMDKGAISFSGKYHESDFAEIILKKTAHLLSKKNFWE